MHMMAPAYQSEKDSPHCSVAKDGKLIFPDKVELNITATYYQIRHWKED